MEEARTHELYLRALLEDPRTQLRSPKMRTRSLRLPDDRPVAVHLAEEVATVDGQPPLSETKLTAIQNSTSAHPGVAIVDDEDFVVAYAAVAEGSDPAEWGVEPVIPIGHRTRHTLGVLIEAIASEAAQRGVKVLRLWLYAADQLEDAIALGFAPERTLLLMRRPLPAEQVYGFPDGVTVRGFSVGTDERRWLDVNNRAFESHPENGNWDHGDLRARLAMPWFDPEGLRMAWRSNTLVGFCWTKVHPEGLGEIYIIATNPEHQGQGIGRALVSEGMRFLSEQDAPAVFLYCEAQNAAAVALYEALGFTTERSHRSLIRQLP